MLEKSCNRMKRIIYIAILTGLIVFVGSCQKEELPSPAGSNLPGNTTNGRLSGPNSNSGGTVILDGEQSTGSGDIVASGDDDRDGGSGKRVNNTINTQSDSTHTLIHGDGGDKGDGEIVGGGDDDRDGGASGRKGN